MDPKFQTTRWSMIAAAGATTPDARSALSDLCKAYWYPLYAFVRREGHDPDTARDLTQAYFALLLEKNYVGEARPDRGRFRSFLITSLKHFLSHERDRTRAAKRGAGKHPIPLERDSAEGRYRIDAAVDLTPEMLFERKWAASVR